MLFFGDRFSLSHAIVLAKLSDDEQRRASAAAGLQQSRGRRARARTATTSTRTIFRARRERCVARARGVSIASHLRFDVEQVVVERALFRAYGRAARRGRRDGREGRRDHVRRLSGAVDRAHGREDLHGEVLEARGRRGRLEGLRLGRRRHHQGGQGARRGDGRLRESRSLHGALGGARRSPRLARERHNKNNTVRRHAARGLLPKNAKRERAALLKRNREHSHRSSRRSADRARAGGDRGKAATPRAGAACARRDEWRNERARRAHAAHGRAARRRVRDRRERTPSAASRGGCSSSKRTLGSSARGASDAAQLIASVQVETCTYCGCSEQRCLPSRGSTAAAACSWSEHDAARLQLAVRVAAVEGTSCGPWHRCGDEGSTRRTTMTTNSETRRRKDAPSSCAHEDRVARMPVLSQRRRWRHARLRGLSAGRRPPHRLSVLRRAGAAYAHRHGNAYFTDAAANPSSLAFYLDHFVKVFKARSMSAGSSRDACGQVARRPGSIAARRCASLDEARAFLATRNVRRCRAMTLAQAIDDGMQYEMDVIA